MRRDGRGRGSIVRAGSGLGAFVLVCGAMALRATPGNTPGVRAAAPDRVVLAALGYSPQPGEVALNRDTVARLTARAAALGARYVVAPELTTVGAVADGCQPARGLAERIPGPSTTAFGALARRHRVWLSVSLLEHDDPARCFVTAVLLGPDGTIERTARKVLVRERADAGAVPGPFRDAIDSIDADGLRLGILSAGDVHAGVPRLAHRGARVVLINADAGAIEPGAAAQLAKDNSTVLLMAGPECTLRTDCGARVFGAAGTREDADGGVVHLTSVEREMPWTIGSRIGLPATVPVPAVLGGSDAVAELGRQLFIDRGLSSTGTVACVTCHLPELAFTNGLPRGVGVRGRVTKRNVPSLLNVAFRPLLQWDGYASSLENFVKYPLSGPTEMDSHYLDRVVPYVRGRAAYRDAFRTSMRIEAPEFEDIAVALSAYVRTLVSGNSPFDRYHYGGDRTALSAAAVRGLATFTGAGGCVTCHTIGRSYALFSDGEYRSLGIGYDVRTGKYRDIGLGGISTNDFAGQFLTPSLRNVALTAPYMHDGSVRTLEDAVRVHEAANTVPGKLRAAERQDLVAFLESLTGDQNYDADGRVRRASGTAAMTPKTMRPRRAR